MGARSVVIALGTLLLAPAMVGAQSRVGLTPRIGLFAATRDLGPAAPASSVWYLHLERPEPTVAFQLTADAAWPGARVNTRLVALATLRARSAGVFNCYPELACPSILLRSERAEVSTQMALLDVVYSPIRAGAPLRPYAVAGAGVKRYHYRWPDALTLVTAGDDIELAPTLNVGLGTSLVILGASLRAEVADYWSPESDNADRYRILASSGAFQPSSALRRRAQHDLVASLGWQILRF
jgi:hypothetical protein